MSIFIKFEFFYRQTATVEVFDIFGLKKSIRSTVRLYAWRFGLYTECLWIQQRGAKKREKIKSKRLQWDICAWLVSCDVREHDISFSLHVNTQASVLFFFHSLRSHVKYELEQNEKSALLNSCTSCITTRISLSCS